MITSATPGQPRLPSLPVFSANTVRPQARREESRPDRRRGTRKLDPVFPQSGTLALVGSWTPFSVLYERLRLVHRIHSHFSSPGASDGRIGKNQL